MAAFPRLKTGAIAQYPVTGREQFQNQTVRFVDGTEQRYRDSAGTRLEWELQLSQLDEGELAAIEEFYLSNQGSFGSFSFTDPWDGREYENCSMAADGLTLATLEQMRASTRVTVVRNI